MASLKEVKTRIGSIANTKKITLARQMVASAEFHRSQADLDNAGSYDSMIHTMLAKLLLICPDCESPLLKKNGKTNAAFIAMSSNLGMAGTFNSRIIKAADPQKLYGKRKKTPLYPIGKKIREDWAKAGYDIAGNYDHLMERPSAEQIDAFAGDLMEQYLAGSIGQVDVMSYRFKTMGTQEIVSATFLPYVPPRIEGLETIDNIEIADYYILEPSAKELIDVLLPMCIISKFRTALLENRVSEHASRMIAMQVATENADELLEELKLTYNKVRQQNITTELLDITGSTFA